MRKFSTETDKQRRQGENHLYQRWYFPFQDEVYLVGEKNGNPKNHAGTTQILSICAAKSAFQIAGKALY